MTPVELILERVSNVKPTANGWMACCPAHPDRKPSLAIAEGDDGRALIHCHARCTPEKICKALGLSLRDLMPKNAPPSQRVKHKAKLAKATITLPKKVAEYGYRDADGELVFQVVRYPGKQFPVRQPKSGGGWVWSAEGLPAIPYGLPELIAAKPDRMVFVVEGEKDVESLREIGLLATCNWGGAGKWTAEHAKYLRHRHVVVIPDNDEPGWQHAEDVARTVINVAKSVKILNLPSSPPKGDISDWIEGGGTKSQLTELAKNAPVWELSDDEMHAGFSAIDDLDLPEFPTFALPKVLKDFVEAESHATQTPRDLAGLLVLALVSATIARKVAVQPWDDYVEPVNLFVAVILEPGSRKSQVFKDVTQPLREIERRMIKEAEPTVARKRSARRQDEARLKKLEKLAVAKNDPVARREAENLAAALEIQPKIALPRLIVDDVTPEKLEEVLQQQDGRIASMSAEGGVFALMAGRYSRNGTPQFEVYLKGHAGDDLNTLRLSRDEIRVPKPAITCAYTIQPMVIHELSKNPVFRGFGLLARFLYALPENCLGSREIATAAVPREVRKAYSDVVQRLTDVSDDVTLKLTDKAYCKFKCWLTEIEPMLGHHGQLESVQDWGAKLGGETLRIAAVLHCAEHGVSGSINEATIAAAVAIAKYLIPHAIAVVTGINSGGRTGDSDARYLLKWIKEWIKKHGKHEFTKRDVSQHCKRRFPLAGDVDPVLEELEQRRYIRERPAEPHGPGRPPSPMYDVLFSCAKE